jgi:hypothetical protein
VARHPPLGGDEPRGGWHRRAVPSFFKRYNVRRDPVQGSAALRRHEYLASQRGTTPQVPVIGKK